MTIESIEIIEVSSFDRIRGEIKPFMRFKDWGFDVYHPRILDEDTSILLLKFQEKVAYYNELIDKKGAEIDVLRQSDKLDNENLNKRLQLTNEIAEIRKKIDNELVSYIETLCRFEEGELEERIKNVLKKPENASLKAYPYHEIVRQIFADINKALYKYNQKKYELDETEENPTEKP